ncbi:MAG TPA: glucan biosynthesis protein G [Opitutaceae bacterium]|nr:glucan biosynthesis protein G [Opitutaceae bacterium]
MKSLPCWLTLTAVLSVLPGSRAQDEPFDFETLRFQAKRLAARPYRPRPSPVPQFLLDLSYDDHRRIVFNPDRTWWRDDHLPFQLQFFHPGFIFNHPVQLHELDGRRVRDIPFDRDLFDYDHLNLPGRIPDTMGFAGFRILYDLNKPGDELGAFLGASYFRLLCRRAVYGLSARGLTINTAGPGGEEFPVFEEFWVRKPAADARELMVYALLDSPSVAGAYQFEIAPGATTVVRVRAAVYRRSDVTAIGLGPLTSMFWHGENSRTTHGDFRPEVHDSDGLLLQRGSGEWLWRPLVNPDQPRVASFADENPRGFGLLQRDRDFEHYQDLEAHYHLRPSAWVEPVGAWGAGAIRLVELPAADETSDNIVAFWVPASLPPLESPLEFSYYLHWYLDGPKRPPAGYAAATRLSVVLKHPGLTRLLIDFDGPYLNAQPADPAIEPVVTVGEGATLVPGTVTLQKNPNNGTWRVTFALQPDGSGRAVELRCFLRKTPHVLTETWSYLWQP